MDNTKSNKTRYDWIDTLKLIGIFYIYLGHFGKNAGQLYPFVFSFHVPLFFFISGIFATAPENNRDLLKVVIKSFKTIVIPYFMFCIISLVFYTIRFQWDASTLLDSAISALKGIRGKVFAESLWFLPCLFVVIIYHSALYRLLKSKISIMVISLMIYTILMPKAIISHPSYFFNTDSALCYLSYYSLGCLLSKIKTIPQEVEQGNFSKLLIAAVLTLSSMIFIASYFYGYEVFFKWIQNPYLRVNAAFLITSILFIPSVAVAYFLNNSLFSSMGRSTIVFCGTEQIFKLTVFSFISMVGLKLTFSNPIQPAILSIACLLVSYFTLCKIYESVKR